MGVKGGRKGDILIAELPSEPRVVVATAPAHSSVSEQETSGFDHMIDLELSTARRCWGDRQDNLLWA